MRYGEPSVAAALDRMRAAGCDRILVCRSTRNTPPAPRASTFDAVCAWLARARNVPELRFVKHFHDHPAYIAALAAGVRRHWDAHGRGAKLVMSFHGLPRFALERGDPYHCECQATGRLLARGARPGAGPVRGDLPVALRARRVAAALHRADPDRAGARRASAGSTWSARASSRTASRRWRKSESAAQRAFLANGGREFQLLPA